MERKLDKICKIIISCILSMSMMFQYTSIIFAEETAEMNEEPEQEKSLQVEDTDNEEEIVYVDNDEDTTDEENDDEEWVEEEFEISLDDFEQDAFYNYTDEELYMRYAQEKLNVNDEGILTDETAISSKNEMASSYLSGDGLNIFNLWKDKVSSVANGEITSTIFTLFSGKSYVFDISDIRDYGKSTVTINFVHDLEVFLLNDCPYELYWFDKCGNLKISSSSSTNRTTGKYTLKSLKISMPVSADYSASGETGTYVTDQTKMSAAIKAAAKAKEIVNEATATCSTDYEKLKYYREQICELTRYADSSDYDEDIYGDTWQLIYVFDDDPDTKVVCEGYTKAFQYLCDLTTFTQGTNCYIAGGYLEGGSHMWNIVTMDDGKNYLADITNSDTGTIGVSSKYTDYLFIAPCKSGSVTGSYLYSISESGSDTVEYEYDDETLTMYSTEDLTISKTAYSPTAATAYTISYAANGGSGSMTSQSVQGGNSVSLLSNAFTKTGYTFNGWTGSDGKSYTNGQTISVSSNLTLTAKWKANTYTINYNANGGSGTMSSQSMTYDTSSNLTANTFTKSGSSFSGWALSASGTVKYADKASVQNLASSGSITLYAIWSLNSLTLTFNGNGGSVSTTSKSIVYGDTYGTLPTPTRTGYSFSGWYTTSTGGTQITSTSTVSVTVDQTLYAHWTAKTYTVTFDPGEGSVSPTSMSVTYADTYGTLPTPTRDGYSFSGWYTTSTGGTQITSTSTVLITANKTLYAHWSENQFVITFDANGGSVSTKSKTVTYADTYGTLPTPTRTGYSFNGWYTTSTGGTQITDTSTVSVTADQTLYAHWTAKTYTVTFDPGEGSVSPTSMSVTYAGTYGTLPTPTRTGYSFSGWYTTSTGGTQITSTSTVSITANKTLYAHWTAKTYTVTFDPGEGSVSPTSMSVTYADTYGTLPTPTRTGYSFEGWYTTSTGGTQITSTSTVSITANKTLYAHWTAKTYTVTFDPGEGSVSPTSMSVTYAGTYGTLPTPTRDGYSFEGWYTASTGGNQITAESTVSVTEDETLYAHYEADPVSTQLEGYSLTLDGSIGVNFYLTLADYVDPDTSNFVVTLPGKEAETIPVSKAGASTMDGTEYTVFSVAVSVKEITSQISFYVELADGRKGETYTYTVEDYANYILEHYDSSAKEYQIALAMMTYGSYTMDYFDSSASRPKTIDQLSDCDLSQYQYTLDDQNDDVAFVGARMVLTSKPGLKLYFTGDANFKVDGVDVSTVTEGNYNVIVINDITDMTKMYQITSENFSLNYGLFSYGKIALKGKNENLKNLVKAMYAYSTVINS